MEFDPGLALGSFLVAIIVGLTGMGGGALMTPMLMLFFGVPPLAAVSSDLVASAVMKPVGTAVHMRRGTVDTRLVGWLCAGSVPSAFCGVLLARALGGDESVQEVIRRAMGVALLLAAAGLTVRAYLALVDRARRHAAATDPKTATDPQPETDAAAAATPRRTAAPGEPAAVRPPRVTVRPVPTLLVGAVGGLVVGMTSVGSGSLIIVGLIALYPALRANQLVGTDLAQAVPLVISAALGHILFGDFRPDLTLALIAGSIPGVYLGSLASSRAPGGLVRRALALVLFASALKLFDLDNLVIGWLLLAAVVGGTGTWMLLRRRYGLPALVPRWKSR
jgi:uncharacterized membrane protein YfcA